MGWRDRSTGDIVALVLALTVAFVMAFFAVGTVVAAFHGPPDGGVGPYFSAISDTVTTLIGALIGYLAGKGQGRKPPPVE